MVEMEKYVTGSDWILVHKLVDLVLNSIATGTEMIVETADR